VVSVVAPAAHVVDALAVRVLAVGVAPRAAAECAAALVAVVADRAALVVAVAREARVAVTADVAVATVVAAARRCRSARGAISSRT
jgi:hypothetical protein